MGTVFGFKFDFWTLWGFVARFFFLLSFVVQWYHSEKKKVSHLPADFWYIRIFASAWLIVYVIVRRDIVFLMATLLQVLICARNIYLIRNHSAQH
jgi:lipid-A-disaccharide synthase-like uncharacterized protein